MASRTAALVLSLAIFATIGVILLGPVTGVVAENTGTTSITNETVNADYDQVVDLQGYDVNAGTVTVYGLNDTSGNYEVASSPGDYSLNEGPGSVSFNSSSTLIQDGEQVKVTYDYTASDALTTLVIGFAPLMIGVLIFVVVARNVEGMM